MRIFITKKFAKFIRKEKIMTSKLCQIVNDVELGRVDARLGGAVIKQRIARINQGSSGGYRIIVIYNQGQRIFFVHGFSKTNEDNITITEQEDFKTLASLLLSLDEAQLSQLLEIKELRELNCDEPHENL